MPIVDFYW